MSQFFASVAEYWSFSFSISPSNEYPGLISFRIDWLDLLAVQGTFKILLQHRISKASISLVFSFLYSPTLTSIHDYWKSIALTRWTFVGKVMSLLLNMLSRMDIAFLPRSKRLLISWLHSSSAVILEPPQKRVCHCFHCFHKVMGPDAMIFVFWMLSFKPTFHSPLSLSSRGFLVPLHFLP